MRISVLLAENPSTGYRWESDQPADQDEFMPQDGAGLQVGAGGTRVLTYIDAPDEINLVYRRGFEPDTIPPIDSFTISRGTHGTA